MKIKIFILFLFGLLSVQAAGAPARKTLTNFAHLERLYEEVEIDGAKTGIVHIYADYPDYKWVDAEGEGITCVDDNGRAAILYMNEYRITKNPSYLDKAEKLARFTLKLQAPDGFFYNFVNKDLSVNKTFKTSINEPNWWSWRALWALAEGYEFFKLYNAKFAAEIEPVLTKGMNAMLKWIDMPETEKEINGFMLPANLPFQSASDQAAVIIKSLVPYYRVTKRGDALKAITKLSDAVLKMQAGNKTEFPYYAFLSWQTTWHAWGSSQSDALLQAYKITGNKKYLNAALNEIENFYKFLREQKYINEFEIEKKNGKTEIKNKKVYSQIAYGIAPMVIACAEAGGITGKSKYLNYAFETGKWFFGENIISTVMYHPKSGGCYDGISAPDVVNKNMGAESTIEALFAMQTLEKCGMIKKHWNDYYKKFINE